MKKLLSCFFLSGTIGLCAMHVRSDTTTTRTGLTKPSISSPNWGPKLNTNFDIIDSSFSVLSGTNTDKSTTTHSGQQLFFPGGTSAPGIAFSSDTATGIRLPITNSISMVANKIDRIGVDSAGNIFLNPDNHLNVDNDQERSTNPGYRTIQWGIGSQLYGSTQGYIVGQQIQETCLTNNLYVDSNEISRYINTGPVELMCLSTGGDINFYTDVSGATGTIIVPATNETTLRASIRNAGHLEITKTSNQLLLGNESYPQTWISVSSPTATRTIRIPDVGQNTSFVLDSGTASIKGSFDGSTPSAGYYGEYTSSAVTTFSTYTTSTQFGDLARVLVSTGVWNIFAHIEATLNGATPTGDFRIGVSQTGGNSTSGLVQGVNLVNCIQPSASWDAPCDIIHYRQVLSSPTTFYFKFRAAYTGGPPQATGTLSAERVPH